MQRSKVRQVLSEREAVLLSVWFLCGTRGASDTADFKVQVQVLELTSDSVVNVVTLLR